MCRRICSIDCGFVYLELFFVIHCNTNSLSRYVLLKNCHGGIYNVSYRLAFNNLQIIIHSGTGVPCVAGSWFIFGAEVLVNAVKIVTHPAARKIMKTGKRAGNGLLSR